MYVRPFALAHWYRPGGEPRASRRARTRTIADASRVASLVLTGLFLLVAAAIAATRFQAFEARGLVGVDRELIAELGRRWVVDGTMYLPYQFVPYAYDYAAGTTDIARMPGLYPPIAGPFLWLGGHLPAVLWWAIPLAVIIHCVARWRPAIWSLPLLAVLLAFPNTPSAIIAGNTTMWIAAGVSAGLMWRWPILITLLKPTFAPLILLHIRSRVVLGGLLVAGLASLLALPDWLRYFEVLRQSNVSLNYSVENLPILAIPVVAWVAGTPGARFRRSVAQVLGHRFRDKTLLEDQAA
jgi:hypothetical protein